ncbi:MAG: NUDIX domain-containing protein [Actinomycetota bacterium]|nr:NUDIX domain-containing protein [Actinomycetota bacterium]
MPTQSAGLLVYRLSPRTGAGGRSPGPQLEVLLVHPGGPYWRRRDDGSWSIPKGEVEAGEDSLAAAEREFAEELGVTPPSGPRLALGEVVQAGGKRVRAWAVAGDLDVSAIRSDTFSIEWPPATGTLRSFPEVDRAAWYDLDAARRKLLPGQLPLLDRLVVAVAADTPPPPRTAR